MIIFIKINNEFRLSHCVLSGHQWLRREDNYPYPFINFSSLRTHCRSHLNYTRCHQTIHPRNITNPNLTTIYTQTRNHHSCYQKTRNPLSIKNCMHNYQLAKSGAFLPNSPPLHHRIPEETNN